MSFIFWVIVLLLVFLLATFDIDAALHSRFSSGKPPDKAPGHKNKRK